MRYGPSVYGITVAGRSECCGSAMCVLPSASTTYPPLERENDRTDGSTSPADADPMHSRPRRSPARLRGLSFRVSQGSFELGMGREEGGHRGPARSTVGA